MTTKPKTSRKKTGWLDTAIDIEKVLSIDKTSNTVLLGGRQLTENQVIELKSELALLARMTVYPILLESVKQQAINVGINTSTSFENVLTAKSMLLLLQWMREWGQALNKIQIKKIEKV